MAKKRTTKPIKSRVSKNSTKKVDINDNKKPKTSKDADVNAEKVDGGTNKEAIGKVKKRKAKRVAPIKKVSGKRKPSVYNIVQKGVSDYCVKNYNRKCTKKEISEIYQELKLRYVDGYKSNKLTADQIVKTINEKLAFRNSVKMPTPLKEFPYFDLLPRLQGNDGLFFRSEDTIILDFSGLNDTMKELDLTPFKLYEVKYKDLDDLYVEEIYPKMKEFTDAFYSEFGYEPSPPPEFVFNESESDYDNRLFVYEIDVSEVTGTEGGKEEGKKKKPKKTDEEDVDVYDIDFDEEEGGKKERKGGKKDILEGGEGKGVGESENVRLKELELKIKEEERKIKEKETEGKKAENVKLAMELLRDGIIDKDEFKKIVGL